MNGMTKAETKAALEAAGYQAGSYADFLGLSGAEEAEVEARGSVRDAERDAADGDGSAACARPRRAAKAVAQKESQSLPHA